MSFEEIGKLLYDAWQSRLFPVVAHYAITFAPILLAALLGSMFWNVWMRYVRLKNFLGLKYAVIEVKLPKDTFKSPLAMETILHAIHNTSPGSKYAQYWKGETRPWYSLEIASFEGQVKFFVWTEDRRKANLMAAFYSQYPGIEMIEREDYAKTFQLDPKVNRLHAMEFEFTKADPYPIKTYVDYGLDKDPKEEFKIDPLTHMIEWMGSLRPNEQVWFQFICIAHVKEQVAPGHIWMKRDKWKDEAIAEVNKILVRDPKTKTSAGQPDPETGYTRLAMITEGERDIVAAIERSISKLPFDVCIRAVYIAQKDAFDTPFGIGGRISSMKQFNTEHLNGFKPNGKRFHMRLGDPWLDYKDQKRNNMAKEALMAYRRRSAFYPPFVSPTLILNTEELATIWHLPGSVSATPGLERVPSKKAEAPSNLPI